MNGKRALRIVLALAFVLALCSLYFQSDPPLIAAAVAVAVSLVLTFVKK